MALFLEVFEKTGNLAEAARRAKVDRTTHYRKIESDPSYRKLFEEAEQRAIAGLEAEAWRRARKGSDYLLVFLLKSLKPETYRERVTQEITGTINIIEILEAGRQRALQMRRSLNVSSEPTRTA